MITGDSAGSSELRAADEPVGGEGKVTTFPALHPRDARDAVTQLSKLSSLTTLTLIEAGVHKHRLGT